MAKLITKHDKFHAHKIFGVLCLLHFAYRFYRRLSTGCNAFKGDSFLFSSVLLAMHLYLHLSSFSFKLPKQRNSALPLIWHEFRWHNAIFATRNILGSLALTTLDLNSAEKNYGFAPVLAAKLAFIYLWMYFADMASKKVQYDQATTRKMPYPEEANNKNIALQKNFYVSCQFHATMLCITDGSLSFLCVFAMEIAAFSMTLCRKGMLSTLGWHRVYFLALWSVYAVVLSSNIEPSVFIALVFAVAAKETRIRMGIDKYLVWALAVLAAGTTHKCLQTYLAGDATLRYFQVVAKLLFGYGALKSVSDCWWCLMPRFSSKNRLAYFTQRLGIAGCE